MPIFPFLIGFLYILVLFSLALFGFRDLFTTILFLANQMRPRRKMKLKHLDEWPSVTIQLPIYNEKYTVKRLLRAVTQLDYPADRLQIQVLDDSTDETSRLVSQLVDEYKSAGTTIEAIHRNNRQGYKAGALGYGLSTATGELIGIFDADFIPQPDWLKKTVPLFQDPNLGCLQTRWGHTNRKYNLLTRAEAVGVDGHFVIEQTVRSENNFLLNFNGTAGLWRRACIDDAGGWEWDTLTEDLDLSYRAQMRGWKVDYLPDVIVPAELPSQVEAFKEQQFRWAKGSFQVVRKILPQIINQADFPWHVRLMALLHLTGYIVHPLMLAVLLLTLPVGLFVPAAFRAFPLSIVAAFGPPLLYTLADAPQTASLRERLRLLPLLVIIGFGLSLSTSIAVFEGLLGRGGVFVRTPKLNQMNTRQPHKTIDRDYQPPVSPLVWAEIGLGFYALYTITILYPLFGWSVMPWMMIYALGFFYIAGLNLLQHNSRQSESPNRRVIHRHSADRR